MPRTVGPLPLSEESTENRIHNGEPIRCINKVRGYDHLDSECHSCLDEWECQHKTLERFMSASDNLNDVLFAGDEWEPLDTEHWRSVSIDVFWEIEDEDFREIRSQIVDRFREWLEWHKMHDENQVPESLGKLRPPTRNVLKALVPHYSETEDYYLDKVHVPDIAKFNKKESERWTYHARIPYWVQDNWLSKTTGNQWKVFCYIVRRCTFDPSHKHFGRCWLKYEVIRKRTGVQGVQSCAKALQQLGLIKATHVRRNYGDGVVTTNHFTVTFFAEMKKKGL